MSCLSSGSSGMMEVEAARVLWQRSVERYKLRYTVLLSDSDAKTFNELTAIKPYGDEVPVEKEECVNHVSKRLGTALRNMAADCRKRCDTRRPWSWSANAERNPQADHLLQPGHPKEQFSRGDEEGSDGFTLPLLLHWQQATPWTVPCGCRFMVFLPGGPCSAPSTGTPQEADPHSFEFWEAPHLSVACLWEADRCPAAQ